MVPLLRFELVLILAGLFYLESGGLP